MSMAHPKNSILFRDFKAGKISVRQARKLSRNHNGQGRIPLTPAEKMIKTLIPASKLAFLAGYNAKEFAKMAEISFKKNNYSIN